MRMTIFQLWVLSAVILGIAEVILIWHAYQGMENVPKNFLFHIRFWETMLAGNLQKIVILTLGLNILVFFGKWIQYIFLGRLRELESHKSGDRIRDYILMKTVFIGAVVGSGGGEDDDKEILIWFVWLTMVGFLKHFGLLCRDRLEYMTLSIRSSASEYARLMALLVLVLVGNAALVRLCLSVFGCWLRCPPGGLSALALLLFECVIITIDSAQTLVRFAVHFINEARGGRWEHRGFYLFSSELLCELVIQGLTLAHLLHVWALHGLSLSLTDALLFIHARAVLHSIRGRLAALRTYVTMDRRFRDASKEELLSHDDHCSICHEPMSSAKVLPCGHIFHLVCLRGWLEHSPTCPICRRAVQPTLAAAAAGGGAGAGAAGAHLNDGGEGGGGDGSDGGAGQEEAQAMQMLDNLDVFAAAAGEDMARAVAGAGDGGGVDGSGVDGGGGVAMLVGDEPVIRRQAWTIGWGGGTGWASWLPRFSIEVVRQHVTRGDPAGRRLFAVELSAGGGGVGLAAAGGDGGGSVRDSVVEAAVAQVLNVLPDLCPHAVRRDLLMTGDLQLTLENGLEGNIRYRSDPVGESPAPSPATAAAAAATVAAAVPVSAAATAVVAVSAAAPAVVAVSPAAAAAAVAAPAQQQEGMSEGYAAGVAAEAMVGAGEAVAASALSKEIGIAASSVVEPCGVGLTGGVSREDELLAAAAGRGEQVIEIVSSGGVGSGVGCDEGGRTGGQQCAAGSDVYNAVNEITCVQGDGSASR